MSSLTKCNFCTAEYARAFSQATKQSFEIRPDPICNDPEMLTQSSIKSFNNEEGVSLWVGGTWVAWLMRLPSECVCFTSD